jgi:hypothetical protein
MNVIVKNYSFSIIPKKETTLHLFDAIFSVEMVTKVVCSLDPWSTFGHYYFQAFN